MIRINGSKGGGQMLRTALTLSAVKGRAFRIQNIRGNRSNPGLRRQHLECVRSAAELCGADLQGDSIGSEELVFKPGRVGPKSICSDIGTAGSISLLFDTVLPITSQFDRGFSHRATGGTEVKWSPGLDYLKHVKLPLLRDYGLKAELERKKTGYYPKGGGEAVLETKPHSLERIEIRERGALQRFEIYSRASEELEDRSVAERQAEEAGRKLKNSFESKEIQKNIGYELTDSTGSSLLVKAVYENSIAGFDSLGERGKSSEEVAGKAVRKFRSFHSSNAAVDRCMADQLMVFMAITGGDLVIPEVTDHVQTNAEVIESFGEQVAIEQGREISLRL